MHRIRAAHAARRMAVGAGLLAILVATPAAAQHADHRHDMEEHLAQLQEKLGLTDSQVDQIRAIATEEHARMEQLHAEGDVDHEAFRQHREEIHQRIEAILTEEQRDRLEELHAEHEKAHGEHGGESGHRPHDR